MEAPGHVEFVHRSWPADPVQLSTIRHQLADWLAPLRLTEVETADVVLAVDEAVSNAVEHAYGPGESGRVELTLWTEPDTLCIEVVDHGRWRPPPQDAQHVPETAPHASRGIGLMNTMVESVLIHFDDRGSRVLLRQHIPADPAGEMP
ncbi:ATP-binding protein [Pseudonocardia sp. CA-107938]|uniref:ATP-binding protein n=1 Tax=Pseudonocardia sp. CA-107938 TaxID=3240021 RepID=UPI003D90600A